MNDRPTATAVREGVTLELMPEDGLKGTPATIDQPVDITPTGSKVASHTFGASPLDQLQALLARGISLEQVREYLALQREWEAEEARRSYMAAMAAFKREELPEILKKHHVRYPLRDGGGDVDYWHEELFDVVNAIVPAMAKHGLTHKWVPTQTGKDLASMVITVRCVVTHERGHSDFVELYAAPDTSGKKNPIQSLKSAISYLERITALAITGTAAKGMDDDGRGTGGPEIGGGGAGSSAPRGKPETREPQARPQAQPSGGAPAQGYASEKQIGLLERRCSEFGVSKADVCEYMQVPTLDDLPRGKVDVALKWIEGART